MNPAYPNNIARYQLTDSANGHAMHTADRSRSQISSHLKHSPSKRGRRSNVSTSKLAPSAWHTSEGARVSSLLNSLAPSPPTHLTPSPRVLDYSSRSRYEGSIAYSTGSSASSLDSGRTISTSTSIGTHAMPRPTWRTHRNGRVVGKGSSGSQPRSIASMASVTHLHNDCSPPVLHRSQSVPGSPSDTPPTSRLWLLGPKGRDSKKTRQDHREEKPSDIVLTQQRSMSPSSAPAGVTWVGKIRFPGRDDLTSGMGAPYDNTTSPSVMGISSISERLGIKLPWRKAKKAISEHAPEAALDHDVTLYRRSSNESMESDETIKFMKPTAILNHNPPCRGAPAPTRQTPCRGNLDKVARTMGGLPPHLMRHPPLPKIDTRIHLRSTPPSVASTSSLLPEDDASSRLRKSASFDDRCNGLAAVEPIQGLCSSRASVSTSYSNDSPLEFAAPPRREPCAVNPHEMARTIGPFPPNESKHLQLPKIDTQIRLRSSSLGGSSPSVPLQADAQPGTGKLGRSTSLLVRRPNASNSTSYTKPSPFLSTTTSVDAVSEYSSSTASLLLAPRFTPCTGNLRKLERTMGGLPPHLLRHPPLPAIDTRIRLSSSSEIATSSSTPPSLRVSPVGTTGQGNSPSLSVGQLNGQSRIPPAEEPPSPATTTYTELVFRVDGSSTTTLASVAPRHKENKPEISKGSCTLSAAYTNISSLADLHQFGLQDDLSDSWGKMRDSNSANRQSMTSWIYRSSESITSIEPVDRLHEHLCHVDDLNISDDEDGNAHSPITFSPPSPAVQKKSTVTKGSTTSQPQCWFTFMSGLSVDPHFPTMESVECLSPEGTDIHIGNFAQESRSSDPVREAPNIHTPAPCPSLVVNHVPETLASNPTLRGAVETLNRGTPDDGKDLVSPNYLTTQTTGEGLIRSLEASTFQASSPSLKPLSMATTPTSPVGPPTPSSVQMASSSSDAKSSESTSPRSPSSGHSRSQSSMLTATELHHWHTNLRPVQPFARYGPSLPLDKSKHVSDANAVTHRSSSNGRRATISLLGGFGESRLDLEIGGSLGDSAPVLEQVYVREEDGRLPVGEERPRDWSGRWNTKMPEVIKALRLL